ncbi:MAG: hypothetical protein ABSE45_12435 [Candidatus Acidiferrales bacterium]|jgi:hypothetical protein
MHPTFEKFLEPILDKSLSPAQRRFYAAREIQFTRQANSMLKSSGDTQGLKVGEEYLNALKELLEKEGLNLSALF